ncbi:unnamed protein product, partial [Coccothraustes coccothraustes]
AGAVVSGAGLEEQMEPDLSTQGCFWPCGFSPGVCSAVAHGCLWLPGELDRAAAACFGLGSTCSHLDSPANTPSSDQPQSTGEIWSTGTGKEPPAHLINSWHSPQREAQMETFEEEELAWRRTYSFYELSPGYWMGFCLAGGSAPVEVPALEFGDLWGSSQPRP